MKVFIDRKGSALRVVAKSTGKNASEILTHVVRDLGKQELSGKIVSYVEEGAGINSITFMFSVKEADLVPDVIRDPKKLLN